MKIHVCYNKEFAKYKDFFLSNLYTNDKITIFDHLIDVNRGDFGTESWHLCMQKRILLYQGIFSKLCDNEVFIHSDLDVYYIQPDKLLHTYNQFLTTDLDILGMSEYFDRRDHVNGGFYMIKKNKRTSSIFDTILSYNLREFTFGDQDVLNLILKHKDIRYKTSDPQSYTMQCYFSSIDSVYYRDIIMIHATCVGSIEEKLKAINNIKYSLWWNNAV